MTSDKIDFNRIHEDLIPDIQEINKNISHSQFVKGVKNGTMGFKVMEGEPNELTIGYRKVTFNILVMLYTFGPLLIIPIFAYEQSNWGLLFGIAFTYAASYLAACKKTILIFLFTCFAVGVWFKTGFSFYQYISFFYFSSLWGFFLFKIADNSQSKFAIQTLVKNPEVFNNAIAKNRIMIIHKDKEDIKKAEEINQEQATAYSDSGDKKCTNRDYNGAIIEYTKAIEKFPYVTVLEKRGNARLKIKDYEGAILDYSEAIYRMPTIPNKNKFADIYTCRGEAKKILGFINEAQLDFIEADKLRNK